jgi:DNA-binding HxlR family transcriptional regulator
MKKRNNKQKAFMFIGDGTKKRDFSLIFRELDKGENSIRMLSRLTGFSYDHLYNCMKIAEDELVVTKTRMDNVYIYKLTKKGIELSNYFKEIKDIVEYWKEDK